MVDQTILNSVAVYSAGEVLAGAREQVRVRVARFLGRLPDCWCSARVRLSTVHRRGLSWAALIQANLEFKAQPVRAQVASAFFAEAGGLVVERLGEQLARLANPAQPRPWPPRSPRPEPVHLPVERRRIARTKRYPLTRCDPQQAALLMDLGDYDFYLFTDTTAGGSATGAGGNGGGAAGVDAVIYRVGPTGYRLARLDGLIPPPPDTTLPITSNVHQVPRYTLAQAATQLGATELRFLFFRHADTGHSPGQDAERGAVIYRRYDGQYALLTAVSPHDATVNARLRLWGRRGGQ